MSTSTVYIVYKFSSNVMSSKKINFIVLLFTEAIGLIGDNGSN